MVITITKECTLDYESHSWIKKESIREKTESKKDFDKNDKETQEIMIEKLLEENPNLSSLDVLQRFRQANQQTQINIGMHEINFIRKNMKRRILDKKSVMERIEDIKNEDGENLCKSKVLKIY